MSKKLILLISFLLVLPLVGSVSAGWWEAQTNWTGAGDGVDWHDANNWSNGEPNAGLWACVQGAVNDPCIVGSAVTSRLSVACWRQDDPCVVLTISPQATTIEAGWALDIGTIADDVEGGEIDMYAGTVTASTAGGDGLLIGGGDTGLKNVYGIVKLYGGTISVAKFTIRNGTVNLYGGALEDTALGSSFTIGAKGKINVAPGTLRIKGDRSAPASLLNTYINSGQIVAFDDRGDLFVDYNVTTPTYTTVVAQPKLGRAWGPSPANRATDISMTPTLIWFPGDWVAYGQPNNGHDVYLGTDQNAVTNATVGNPQGVYKGRQDANSYSPPGMLGVGTTYYWRIDEVNDANASSPWKGVVWKFTTLGGSARDPQPTSGSVGINITPLKLIWTSGLWAATTKGHDVFLGKDPNEIATIGPNDPDPNGVHKGLQDANSYSLSNLAYNTSYYWRIDEVNNAHPLKRWKGEVWSFTIPDYYIVDDFNYADNNAMLQKWHTDSIDWSCSLYNGGATLTWQSGVMVFAYDNNSNTQGNDPFSEGRFDCNNPESDWTGGGKLQQETKLLQISFQGAAGNQADPNYDRMYVAMEDTNSNFAMLLHDDPNAQTNGNWQQWNINLASFSSAGVNLHHIKYFYMGLGQRCNYYGVGGEGTVRFDNLRLYPSSCVLEYGPTADLTGDCNVNLGDVDAMVRDWLDSDKTVNISPIAQPNAPVLWYKFDETAGPNVPDAVGDFNGTIYNLGPETWEAAGGYDGNGCINFYYGRNTYVTVPPQVLNFVSTTNAFSVSLWVNSDPVHTPGDTWPQVFDVIKGPNEVIQMYCPAPLPPIYPYGPGIHYDVNGFTVARDNMRLSDFAGRWNHFVVTRDGNAGTMAIYLNGQDVNESNNITVGMFTPPVDRFYIGTRDQWWGYWAGRVDDFRVYDYALSAAEAGYIATRGTGSIYLPLGSPANLYQSGPPQAINFKDFSILAQQWLTQQLWP